MNLKSKIIILLAIVFAGCVQADLPTNWNGLIEVKSKRMDAVYLLPGADFRPYVKVMIDPSVVAFQKNWLRDMNSSQQIGMASRRITKTDAQEIIQSAQKNFDQVFAETLTKNGFMVVTEPGPDVLHLSPGVANLYINAPAVNGPTSADVYTLEAGEGTLALEVRDSQTNTILGSVVDTRETRNFGVMQISNQSTNISDYRALVNTWASICAKGLDELKANSPVPLDLQPMQKIK